MKIKARWSSLQVFLLLLCLCAVVLAACTGTPKQPVSTASPQGTQTVSQAARPPSPVSVPTQSASNQEPQNQQTSANYKKGQGAGSTVDLVICLDCSNSMDALINSAKQKLWDIVNEVASLKPMPKLRVALLSYGNDSYNPEKGWVRLETDFTSDLDMVNKKLFALTTNGGTEYVTRVISDSLNNLKWNKDRKTLKLLFVAGNEPASQDSTISIMSICQKARQYDVIINAIHCCETGNRESQSWKEVASYGGGKYFAIDQNKGTLVVNTPYDQKLAELSNKLNDTYIAYGPKGIEAKENQSAQDANAKTMSNYAAASRARVKSEAVYENSEWDVVDACKNKKDGLKGIKKENLPENMQKMSAKEQQEYIDSMGKQRADIQKQIKDLSNQRDEYIKNQSEQCNETDSFDAAVNSAITEQAVNKGFEK